MYAPGSDDTQHLIRRARSLGLINAWMPIETGIFVEVGLVTYHIQEDAAQPFLRSLIRRHEIDQLIGKA